VRRCPATVGCVAVALLAAVGAALVLSNAPSRLPTRPVRRETPANVDGLKTAELAHDAAFDRFVACGSAAEAEAWARAQRPGDEARAFSTQPAAACFRDELGWTPSEPVRGAYWTTDEGADFGVHGIIDADGDGVFAHYVATRDANATLVSDPAVE